MRDRAATWIHLLLIHRIHEEKTVGGRGPQENFAKGIMFFRGVRCWGIMK